MNEKASPAELPRVFLSRKFPVRHFEELKRISEFVMHARDVKPSPAGYRRAVRHTDVLIAMVGDEIDAGFLDAAPRLKLVANCGVGFNNLDLGEITRRGILATNTPGVVMSPRGCAMSSARCEQAGAGDTISNGDGRADAHLAEAGRTAVLGFGLGVIGLPVRHGNAFG